MHRAALLLLLLFAPAAHGQPTPDASAGGPNAPLPAAPPAASTEPSPLPPAASTEPSPLPPAASALPPSDETSAQVGSALPLSPPPLPLPALPRPASTPELEPLPPIEPSPPRTPPPSPAPSVEPPPAERPIASGSPSSLPGVSVRLKDNPVFVIRAPLGGRSPEERAQRATRALSAAVEDPRATELRVVRQGTVAVIYAGPSPLVQLGEEDAELAGDGSLDVHANAVASQIRAALDSERWRSRVSKNVFSLSLVVFLGLIAVYLIRKMGALTDRVRAWLDQNGERELGLRVRDVEIVHPATLRTSALVGLEIAKWLGQIGVIYVWVVASLSLFEATRGYTQRLTGLVVTPFSELMERLARALPLLIVATIAAFAVFVLVRFIGLFFASVARRETALTWLPPELAAPTSVLLRFSIVVAALVFAAPIVTGGSDGAFTRTGVVILGALGLSSTPLLASGLVGSIVLFGRRLRVGEYAEFGGQLGRVSSIGLLETTLRLLDETELRVPHLLLLVRPLRGLGAHPRLSVEIVVSAATSTRNVRRVFDDAARSVGRNVRAELVGLDADGIAYRVTATCDSLEQRSELLSALLDALADAQIPLGRASNPARALTSTRAEHA